MIFDDELRGSTSLCAVIFFTQSSKVSKAAKFLGNSRFSLLLCMLSVFA